MGRDWVVDENGKKEHTLKNMTMEDVKKYKSWKRWRIYNMMEHVMKNVLPCYILYHITRVARTMVSCFIPSTPKTRTYCKYDEFDSLFGMKFENVKPLSAGVECISDNYNLGKDAYKKFVTVLTTIIQANNHPTKTGYNHVFSKYQQGLLGSGYGGWCATESGHVVLMENWVLRWNPQNCEYLDYYDSVILRLSEIIVTLPISDKMQKVIIRRQHHQNQKVEKHAKMDEQDEPESHGYEEQEIEEIQEEERESHGHGEHDEHDEHDEHYEHESILEESENSEENEAYESSHKTNDDDDSWKKTNTHEDKNKKNDIEKEEPDECDEHYLHEVHEYYLEYPKEY